MRPTLSPAFFSRLVARELTTMSTTRPMTFGRKAPSAQSTPTREPMALVSR